MKKRFLNIKILYVIALFLIPAFWSFYNKEIIIGFIFILGIIIIYFLEKRKDLVQKLF